MLSLLLMVTAVQCLMQGDPHLQLDQETIENMALRKLGGLLASMGTDLRRAGLPSVPPEEWVGGEPPAVARERSRWNQENQDHAWQARAARFNDDQREIFNLVRELIDTSGGPPKSRVVFMDGLGGTGKTYVYNTLLAYARSRVLERDGEGRCTKNGIGIAVASSGIAALLLKGGTTAHSRLKIPIKLGPGVSSGITMNSPYAALLRAAGLLVWDEASMMHRHAFECVDRMFRDIMKTVDPALEFLPFGGKVVVIGGDFRQVLPVVPKATRKLPEDRSSMPFSSGQGGCGRTLCPISEDCT
jgi:hypothetical protein